MNAEEKYDQAFFNSFDIEDIEVDKLQYGMIPDWDSVGQMTLISEIEMAFDIMLSPDEIISLKSYEIGKDILATNHGIIF